MRDVKTQVQTMLMADVDDCLAFPFCPQCSKSRLTLEWRPSPLQLMQRVSFTSARTRWGQQKG